MKERAKCYAVSNNIHDRICSRHVESAPFRDNSLITCKGFNKYKSNVTEGNVFQCMDLPNQRFLKDEHRINEDVNISLSWL